MNINQFIMLIIELHLLIWLLLSCSFARDGALPFLPPLAGAMPAQSPVRLSIPQPTMVSYALGSAAAAACAAARLGCTWGQYHATASPEVPWNYAFSRKTATTCPPQVRPGSGIPVSRPLTDANAKNAVRQAPNTDAKANNGPTTTTTAARRWIRGAPTTTTAAAATKTTSVWTRRGADVTSVWTTRAADVRVGVSTANKGGTSNRRSDAIKAARERDHF